MMRSIAFTTALILLVGCAEAPPTNSTNATGEQQCEREYPTGSMLPRKACLPATTEAERQRQIDALRKAADSPATPH